MIDWTPLSPRVEPCRPWFYLMGSGMQRLRGFKKSARAAEYLQTTYFKQLDRASLQRQFWCGVPVWHGTNSGSGSGTQTLESFHSYWQEAVKQSTRADPRAIFGRMERLFRDGWSEKFAWSEARVFQTWPQCPAQELLNGQALRTAGRLPAVDFWNNREPKLCGFRNYYKIHRRTDSTTMNASGQEGITTFWVMRCFEKKDLAPAQATITKEHAEMIAGLIALEGAALKAQLHKAGILTTSEHGPDLDVDALKHWFCDHCCVMEGHLPNSCWPRLRKRMHAPWPTTVCACLEFLLHGDCEHVTFVLALQDEGQAKPRVNLACLPVVRQTGRKRRDQHGASVGQSAPKRQKKS